MQRFGIVCVWRKRSFLRRVQALIMEIYALLSDAVTTVYTCTVLLAFDKVHQLCAIRVAHTHDGKINPRYRIKQSILRDYIKRNF